jgi:predicted nuclease of predicted toxin-antitoxin system
MKIWIDAQLSPLLADWITKHFEIEAIPVRKIGLLKAKDIDIFRAAHDANAIVLTKDADFPHLLAQHGAPPKIIWLTCGNTSNSNLRRILRESLPGALSYLEKGESLVEISGSTIGPTTIGSS